MQRSRHPTRNIFADEGGSCYCNANGDYCCCGSGGSSTGCCAPERLHHNSMHHDNGIPMAGCHHGNAAGRPTRSCFANGRLTNGNGVCGGYDEDTFTWDDEDMDGGAMTGDDSLIAAGDEIEDEDDSAVDGAVDGRIRGAMMYDMSAIPWDMMSKWCRYTALANLLTLW
jgi:hypothetical protein